MATVNGITVGVTPTGFVRPTLNDLVLDLNAKYKIAFGQYINVLPAAIFGQIVGITAAELDTVWGAAADTYANRYPDTAFGASLDNAVAFNNIKRLGAKFTKVTGVTMTGTANATVQAGKQAALSGSNIPFNLDSDVTFDGSGNATGNFTCNVSGPVQCPATQLSVILTPVTGWSTVNNPTDGVPGTNVETDPALKTRRLQNLETALSGPIDAIRKKILTVAGVVQCTMYENQYNVPDIDGRPPHSFQAYVFGGADQDIYQAIWDSKDGGAQAYGDTCGTAYDSQNQPQPVCFSRLIQENVYGIINVTSDLTYPANGDLLLKEAMVNYINTFQGGQELIVSPNLICQADGVPGVQFIQIKVGLAPSPSTSNNIQPALNEILRSDTSLWTVNHV